MTRENHHYTRPFIKGKIIIIFLLACFALLTAWGISKIAFQQMMVAVDNISEPNNRLRLVNELSVKIGQLDQTQKARLASNKHNTGGFFSETKRINRLIDTLQSQYTHKDGQSARLNKLKKLLSERDRLFVRYIKVRETMMNDRLFTAQVQSLNDLLDQNALQADSGVISTEKKTSTTILTPEGEAQKDTRSFFGKLFGKKKPEEAKTYKVVEQELNIERDTTAQAIKDSILQSMGNAVEQLEKMQRKKSAQFINRENILINANNELISQIQSILKQVEHEVIAQTTYNNKQAQAIVTGSIKKTGFITLGFVVLTVILLYLILTDITRSTRYRKELEEARDEAEYHSRAKQRFLSNMSHEIRTPLQSIFGYAELARLQQQSNKHHIEAIYQSSKHLMQIVNEVLDYNRIISGKFTYTNKVFDMRGLLQEVESVMKLPAENKSLKFTGNYHLPTNSLVNGDPFRLKQVLYNLLGNAIKFTEEGEVLFTVSYVQNGDGLHYTFRVKDTGVGLSANDIDRIFNEFEQAETPGQRQDKGTGLGLAICKELVELQGGSINVESSPGKGSEFIVLLTFTRASEAISKTGTSANPQLKTTKPAKVWVVDDDHLILDLCELLLEKNGIPHKCFNSSTDLLSAPWDDEVRVIFADIRMPGIDGKELCAALKKKVPADTKIYALTAQALPQEQTAILSAGFDGILTKPFSEHDILQLLGINTTHTDAGKAASSNPGLDMTMLKRMTFNDEKQLANILHRFTADTRSDIAELEDALASETDTEKIALLVHRMAGRTGQIGARDLSVALRRVEQLLMDDALSASAGVQLQALLSEMQDLIDYIDTAYPATMEV
ncbi:hypothetical protein GCM10023149_04810 [Mucilaginibacter gynuensis]|uniref:histidine kinase n=1 Tax=Mucilaginibacter gynuensis TaxID=1302236 RepID=A0ABP8FSN1_9SPHI